MKDTAFTLFVVIVMAAIFIAGPWLITVCLAGILGQPVPFTLKAWIWGFLLLVMLRLDHGR